MWVARLFQQQLKPGRVFTFVGAFHVTGVEAVHHQQGFNFAVLVFFGVEDLLFHIAKQFYRLVQWCAHGEGHLKREFALMHLREQFGFQRAPHGVRDPKTGRRECDHRHRAIQRPMDQRAIKSFACAVG